MFSTGLGLTSAFSSAIMAIKMAVDNCFQMYFKLKMLKISLFKCHNGHTNGFGSFFSPVMLSTILGLTSGLTDALNSLICGYRRLFNVFWPKKWPKSTFFSAIMAIKMAVAYFVHK